MGALNAYILATNENDQHQKAVEELENFWMELSYFEPYRQWNGGFVYGFFFEKGIYDMSPMSDYIDEKLGERKTHRHLSIGVTNLLNGSFDVLMKLQIPRHL